MTKAGKAPAARKTKSVGEKARKKPEDIFRAVMQPPDDTTGYLLDVGWLTPERDAAIDEARANLVEAARQLAIVSSIEHTAWNLERLAAMIRQEPKNRKQPKRPFTNTQATRKRPSNDAGSQDPASTAPPVDEFVKAIVSFAAKAEKPPNAATPTSPAPWPTKEIVKVMLAAAPYSAAALAKALPNADRKKFGQSVESIAKAITRIRTEGAANRHHDVLRDWIAKSLKRAGLRLTDDDRERFGESLLYAAIRNGGAGQRDK